MSELKEIPKTILIVDDEEVVRTFVAAVLNQSYKVLVASSGEDALRQSQEYEGPIHLLVSNVQMTGMNGMELGTRLVEDRPDMRVMLMSGYSSGMLVLNEGWHFLSKPFIPSQLRNLVSGILPRTPLDTPDLEEGRHPLKP